ncbi:MAG: hypothetical protein ABIT83_15350 [Massilia sp.]
MRVLTGLVLTLAVGIEAAAAPPLPADHPILGNWRLTLDGGRCSEVYHFRGDGTSLVTSALEVAESEYEIPAKPSAKGFYRMTDRITKDNGKKDCSGEVTKIGSRATNFIQFHPSGDLFLMCVSESLDACIGPFERIAGQTT